MGRCHSIPARRGHSRAVYKQVKMYFFADLISVEVSNPELRDMSRSAHRTSSKKVTSRHPLFLVCYTLSARPASGFLKGNVRRFAQKSRDQRGTLTSPGRIVTLMHQEDWAAFSCVDSFPHEDVVWGAAFAIGPVHAAEVRASLDYRGKDKYTLERVDVHGTGNGKEGRSCAAQGATSGERQFFFEGAPRTFLPRAPR
ncbi:hypothetical protein EDB83DRAFT_1788399 [Lactarius deliciosus]|nr:hypothetical protein EDB83DRAFT_1788399 [Lactarius deliciosus]